MMMCLTVALCWVIDNVPTFLTKTAQKYAKQSCYACTYHLKLSTFGKAVVSGISWNAHENAHMCFIVI